MSANPFIELVARLKKDEASIGLIKKDIESIASILNRQQALKVVCHINTEVTKHLQGELNQLSKNLNLNVGVNTQGVNSNNSTTTNIKIDSTGAKKQADELTNIITQQLQGKASNSITSFVNSIRTQLDDSSKIWTTWNRTAEGALTSFTVSIQKAEGEVNKFKFFANGDEFALLRSVGSDKGELQNAEKILAKIEKSYKALTQAKITYNSSQSTTVEKEEAYKQISLYGQIINESRKTLEIEKLLTAEATKRINIASETYKSNIRIAQSEEAKLSKTQELKRIEENLSQIRKNNTQRINEQLAILKNAYREIEHYQTIQFSPTSSLADKENAAKWIEYYRGIRTSTESQLREEKLLTAEIEKQINDLHTSYNQQFDLIEVEKQKYQEAQRQKALTEKEKADLKEIESIYQQMTSLQKTINSNTSQKGKDEASIQLKERQNDLEAIKKRLVEENRMTKAIDDRISKLQSEYDDVVRLSQKKIEGAREEAEARKKEQKFNQEFKRALQESTEEEKKRLQVRKTLLSEIEKSYQKITAESQIILNPKSTDYRKTVAGARVAEQETLIRQKTEELQLAGLLSSEVSKQISYYHQISAEDILTYRSQQESLSQTRQQTEEIKKQQETYDNIVSSLNKYRNALSGFNTSNITKQNASNTDVQKQVAENQTLLEQIEKISQLLSGGKKNTSATNIERARQALESLIPTLENAKKSNESLNQSLMDGEAEQALASRINNLINQMNKFANTNPKVTKSLKQMRDGMTFADKWQQMVNMLQSGKLDGNAVQQLTNDFRNFKGEADSANLTTSRFFTSMQSQLRMVLQRWISLYAVIGYIRKMIDNIKELDTAMINLQRVTHETGEGYERFLANASDRAKELKTTTSALIEQSYQWAKLGYDMEDSLKLSEASTIFSRVADVGREQAVKNLVTAMKAYGIEAEDVMSIVDKLDKLNNEYAVSAAGLGDGLERAASAMAMTGNSIDQTLAMLTGAGEITQNLENTANGLRIVGLR